MRFIQTDIMKKVILNHIIGDRNKTKKERGKYFYASEGYLPDNPGDSKCGRQIAYKFLGYEEEEIPDEMYPVFALGDLYHDFIQQIFVKEKLATVVEEFTIMYDDDGKYYWIRQNANKIIMKSPVEIHGRLDLKFIVEGIKFIADIKTVNEKAWNYMNNQPKESHYLQIQIYLHHLKMDKGFLLYINKSSGDIKEFMIQYDPEYVTKMLEEYAKLEAKIKSGVLPDRHFKNGQAIPWQCKYCGFTKTCLGYPLEEVKKRTFISFPEEVKENDGRT